MAKQQKATDGLPPTLLRRLLRLLVDSPWLQAREEAVYELLNQECRGPHQRALICELLTRFRYFDGDDHRNAVGDLIAHIVDNWALEESRTLIAAATRDDDPDSGQMIVQIMKPFLAEKNWNHAKLLNRVTRCAKHIRHRPNVVIVDEFAGTGHTMVRRCKELRRQLHEYAHSKGFDLRLEIRVALVFAMNHAVQRIRRDAGVEVYAVHEMQRGISDTFSGKALKKARRRMWRLEAGLKEIIDREKLPHFGWGAAEALFGSPYNAPNSVFPIFWWPKSKDSSDRKTVLNRL